MRKNFQKDIKEKPLLHILSCKKENTYYKLIVKGNNLPKRRIRIFPLEVLR